MPVGTLRRPTLGRARLSFADTAEIDEFVRVLELYERGELSPDQWRAFRLVRGTYGQRQSGDVQMIRVKIPQGILDAPQLEALADVAESLLARLRPHHHAPERPVPLPEAARRGEGHAPPGRGRPHHPRGLRQRGPQRHRAARTPGWRADEVFDVTPYAEALTRYLLRHPLSQRPAPQVQDRVRGLPRGPRLHRRSTTWASARGCATRSGATRRGFRLTAGGGTSILPRSGGVLFEFLPAGEILDVAEAVIRVFARLGDYKHKQRNRMKFLIRELGWDAWRAEFERTSRRCARPGARTCLSIPIAPWWKAPRTGARPVAAAPAEVAARASAAVLTGPGLHPQTRPVLQRPRRGPPPLGSDQRETAAAGRSTRLVTVTVPLGDLTAAQLRLLGELALAYGDGTVRTTTNQDLLFRWVRTADVPKPLPAAGRGRPRRRRRRHPRRRDELPGGGGLPARGHPVARPRQGPRRPPRRAAAPRGRGGRPRHQDQRLPERLRPAPHRGPRIPGQRAPGGREGRAPVLRDGGGRRRRRRGEVRAPRGEDPGTPAHRGPRPPPRALHGGAAPDEPARAFFQRVEHRPGQAGSRRSRSPDRRRRARPEDFVDLGEEERVQGRGHGGGVRASESTMPAFSGTYLSPGRAPLTGGPACSILYNSDRD